jgi:hypothetical protein
MLKPSRSPVRRSHTGVRCRFPSKKMGRMIGCESLLERDAARLFESHPGVVRYVEQPAKHTCYDEFGNAFQYTPDFLVEFANRGHCYFEIKPSQALRDVETVERLSAIERSFDDRDQPFRVLTDRELHAEPRAKTLRRLRSESKTPLNNQHIQALLDQLGPKLELTFGELRARVGDYNALRLIGAGKLHINLNVPLDDEALVFKSLGMGVGSDSLLI